jgi:uncharacterized damage-inducible protein DinB
LEELWIEAFRYHKWANLHLLDVCAKLTDEQLELTAPGTYGTIASTFQHLLAAEQRYLRRFDHVEPAIREDDPFPGVARLKEIAAAAGDRLIKVAPNVGPEVTVEADSDEGRVTLHVGVVLIQALHHGNDHRTHLCTILGAHDITYGDMDVWAYGDATGLIVPVPPKG